jgi:hypothetical protein
MVSEACIQVAIADTLNFHMGEDSRSSAGKLINGSVEGPIDDLVCDCTWGFTNSLWRSAAMSIENSISRRLSGMAPYPPSAFSVQLKKRVLRSLL